EWARYLDQSVQARTYEQKTNGESNLTEEIKIFLQALDQKRFRHFELYNTFQGEGAAATKEYYLSEMELDLTQMGTRQDLINYQVLESPDSSWFSGLEALEVEITEEQHLQLGDQAYTWYELKGYAHAGDDAPGHYKYWSPEFGTLLIWYGHGLTYELEKSGLKPLDQHLEQIKDAIRQQLPLEEDQSQRPAVDSET
ncbi:MAG: hypothetical protein AAFP92_32305, partial [Bacteroidota bacterium]